MAGFEKSIALLRALLCIMSEVMHYDSINSVDSVPATLKTFLDSFPASTGALRVNYFEIPLLSKAEEEKILQFDTCDHSLINGDADLRFNSDEDPIFANGYNNNEELSISIKGRKRVEGESNDEQKEGKGKGDAAEEMDVAEEQPKEGEDPYYADFRERLTSMKEQIKPTVSQGARDRLFTLIRDTYNVIISCIIPTQTKRGMKDNGSPRMKTFTFGPKHHIINVLWPHFKNMFRKASCFKTSLSGKALSQFKKRKKEKSVQNGRNKDPCVISVSLPFEDIMNMKLKHEEEQHHGAEKSKSKLSIKTNIGSSSSCPVNPSPLTARLLSYSPLT